MICSLLITCPVSGLCSCVFTPFNVMIWLLTYNKPFLISTVLKPILFDVTSVISPFSLRVTISLYKLGCSADHDCTFLIVFKKLALSMLF